MYSWANVKDVLDTEVPGEPSAGIFVYYDMENDHPKHATMTLNATFIGK